MVKELKALFAQSLKLQCYSQGRPAYPTVGGLPRKRIAGLHFDTLVIGVILIGPEQQQCSRSRPYPWAFSVFSVAFYDVTPSIGAGN
jgi:hypothetical protein